MLFPIPQDPSIFTFEGVSPTELPPGVIFVGNEGWNEGRGRKNASLSVKSYFQFLLPFSISYIHEIASFPPHPTLLQFPGNGAGLEERKDGNSHCISLHWAVVEMEFVCGGWER